MRLQIPNYFLNMTSFRLTLPRFRGIMEFTMREMSAKARYELKKKTRDKSVCQTCGETFYIHHMGPRHRMNDHLCGECENGEKRAILARNISILERSNTYRDQVKLVNMKRQLGEAMKLYNCKTAGVPGAYIVTKFDNEMNVESSYLVSNGECACPRGSAHSCRHRDMLHRFKQYKHIDDDWFIDWDTRIWHQIAISQTVAEELSARRGIDNEPDTQTPTEVEQPAMPSSPSAPTVSHPAVVASVGAQKLQRRLIRR